MKNRPAFFSTLFASVAICTLGWALSASAQSQNVFVPDPRRDNGLTVQPGEIEQGTLDAPIAYDAGLIDIRSGGLDPNLWQGTSANLATQLIKSAPLKSDNPLVRDMVKAVLLSSGIPPEGDTVGLRQYDATKLEAVSAFADIRMLEALIARSGSAARTPVLQVELSLRQGEIGQACELSDTITEGRAEVFWSRLRTLCHLHRDEIPAAEITADLLRRSDYDNPDFFKLVSVLIGGAKNVPDASATLDPIDKTLYRMAVRKLDFARAEQALDTQADRELRLAALFKFMDELSDEQIEQVFSDLAFDPDNLDASSSFDLDSVLAREGAQGTAQLFLLARAQGNPQSAVSAFSELLKRAQSAGVERHRVEKRFAALFGDVMPSWPASEKARHSLGFFARQAVAQNDGLTLQNLFSAMEKTPEAFRVALAADALNNGFLLAPFSPEIDKGLRLDDRNRAVRDAFLSLALGSQISDTAIEVLPLETFSTADKLNPGNRAILKANAKSRQTAQFILRVVPHLDAGGLSISDLAFIVEQMGVLGLQDYAGRLAAMDFIAGL